MDEKNREELQGNAEVEELTETDLESIAGGTGTAELSPVEGDCESGWCCTS